MILGQTINSTAKRLNPRTLFFLFGFFSILILVAIGITYYLYFNPAKREFSKMSDEVKSVIQTDIADKYLKQVDNRSLSEEERYAALQNLLFFFRTQYVQTHDPDIRNYVATTLNEYAKKNFPKQHEEGDFEIPCSDTKCGREITPEFRGIMDKIQKSQLPSYKKDTILLNLKTLGYTPASDKFNSVMGLYVVIDQLISDGDPAASEAAEQLKQYLKVNYDEDYVSSEENNEN